MKTLKTFNCSRSNTYLFVFTILFFITSCSFPRAVRLFKQGKTKKAAISFEKNTTHRVYDCGAKLYLGKIKAGKTSDIQELLKINKALCECEEETNNKSIKDQTKLKRYDAGRADIREAREGLQKRIFEEMAIKGRIVDLVVLETDPCWPPSKFDSISAIVVNKTINPSVKVGYKLADTEWEPKQLIIPTTEQILEEPGRSCLAILSADEWSIDYNDATIIEERYADVILPANYSYFWKIKKDIFDIFEINHSYCEMDRFKVEHPLSNEAMDCWFDATHDILCVDELRPLLAFHRENPHSVLDESLCNQILCLDALKTGDLNEEEQQQVEDVRMMLLIQRQFLDCEIIYDSLELIEKVAYLSDKYQHHKVVFDLSIAAINYFASESRITLAQQALDTFRPLHLDSSVCFTDFYFQVDKQKWFDNYQTLLEKTKEELLKPVLMTAWNTPHNDEYALVSWGETDEVFFMRRDKITGESQVMTSLLKKDKWTKPVPVKVLSFADDVMPLSMSADGKQMLLKAEGKLFSTYRPDVGRRWLKPGSRPIPARFAGDAWLSPDDSLLLMTYYRSAPTGNNEPFVDLAVSQLKSNGVYGNAKPMKGTINQMFATEMKPIMALGGRMIFYVSNRADGLGDMDMYSVNMSRPRDWSSMEEPNNLGVPLNTFFEDYGLTYFSEYTGNAYFHKEDHCIKNLDIWSVTLGSGIFPENAMRLAGLVLDENGKPLQGGFVEFTPNYQLKVHSLRVSKKGTYNYTVADSTEVVRIFPEIPGYFSERDTTHFLADIIKGQIVRDTFYLTSFDYIRKNYELINSTFHNGTSQFDKPNEAYPELTRLAKIATRMGAELELTGHTDGTGSENGNKQLSYDRANSVKQYLVDKCGFDADKIKVFGYGSSRPECDNTTEEGRHCNRRVDIVFKMPDLR